MWLSPNTGCSSCGRRLPPHLGREASGNARERWVAHVVSILYFFCFGWLLLPGHYANLDVPLPCPWGLDVPMYALSDGALLRPPGRSWLGSLLFR